MSQPTIQPPMTNLKCLRVLARCIKLTSAVRQHVRQGCEHEHCTKDPWGTPCHVLGYLWEMSDAALDESLATLQQWEAGL